MAMRMVSQAKERSVPGTGFHFSSSRAIVTESTES